MRTGYSIGFEHVLTNRTTEDAFQIVEGWLRDEKANIKARNLRVESKPPTGEPFNRWAGRRM